MSNPHDVLARLGIALPPAPKPVAAYVPAVRAGNLIYVSGQLPFANGALLATGPVPSKVSIEDAQKAARQCALNALSVVADQANRDLASWREELTESELRSLRDPRNWVRPAAAGAASVAAGAALVVLGLRRRTPDTKAVESSLRQLAEDAQRLADEARRRLP